CAARPIEQQPMRLAQQANADRQAKPALVSPRELKHSLLSSAETKERFDRDCPPCGHPVSGAKGEPPRANC
ncbi:MAG TPA: hypothetical protein PK359_16265, partial [Burkholderiaceae bacterium]|nr:hypothetical protein [Burkholderiaceae bacterium]